MKGFLDFIVPLGLLVAGLLAVAFVSTWRDSQVRVVTGKAFSPGYMIHQTMSWEPEHYYLPVGGILHGSETRIVEVPAGEYERTNVGDELHR